MATPFRHQDRWVGLLHGLGVLGHLMNLLWLGPAAYWILSGGGSPSERRRRLVNYLAALTVTVAVPYALVISYILGPANHSFSWLAIWLKGSAGLTPDRSFAWHTAGWTGPLQWGWATLQFFWASLWPYGHSSVPAWAWLLTAVSGIALALVLSRAFRAQNRRLAAFSLLWIGLYGLLFSTWEPLTLCYRMAEAVPFAILIAAGLRAWPQTSWRWPLAGLLVATLLPLTLLLRALPMSRTVNNARHQQVLALTKVTPDQSVYLTAGGADWLYLLYFSGRSALNFRALTPERLSQEIARLRRQTSVYIHASSLRDPVARAGLEGFNFRPVTPELPWLQIL